jgi:hypothetical protein
MSRLPSEMALPSEQVLRGALRVLFVAGVHTRSWTLTDDVSRKQVNDLWEALHEIPDLLTRWREESEPELLGYLREYNQTWDKPDLEAAYRYGQTGVG